MASYLEVVPSDALALSVTQLIPALETFLRKITLILPSIHACYSLSAILASVLKIPGMSSSKVRNDLLNK
jgi:hypothetical protein